MFNDMFDMAEYNRVKKMAAHPAFDGYTFGHLEGRYVVSEKGGATMEVAHLGTVDGNRAYDDCFGAVLAKIDYRDNFAPGLWVDSGILYFDVSTAFDDLATARKFGVDNAQIAIYDTVGREVDGKVMHYIDPATGEYTG